MLTLTHEVQPKEVIVGYLVNWLVPQRVCIMQLWGKITLEELEACSSQVVELLRSGDAPVHCIGDTRNVESVPKNLNQVRKMARLFQEPNLGYMFLLNNDRIVTFFASVITQLARINYSSFKDPVALMEVLQDLDSTLPELPPLPNYG